MEQTTSSALQIKRNAAHLRVRTDWRKEELIVKEQGKHVVAALTFRQSFVRTIEEEAYAISS